jgi:fumarate reductase flavoprotein subunit
VLCLIEALHGKGGVMIRENETEIGIDRRSFLAGTGILAAVGLAGTLSACSPQTAVSGDDTDAAAVATDNQGEPADLIPVDETQDCDIIVVGAGGSGLAAAVQASELGASVICIESQVVPGGNLNGVEGCFGIGSKMQKERGIEIDPGATIRSEMTASQFRASGLGYVDMVHASGENIDWLMDQGVQFEDVDVDKGDILVFHRFANRGMGDYVPPMVQKAEENGVVFYYETKGEQLITSSSGAVTGVIALTNDGKGIQFNAKSVIIATGGFADNEEYMAELGFKSDKMRSGGMLGHDGLGHKMAVAAGALSNISNTAFLSAFMSMVLRGITRTAHLHLSSVSQRLTQSGSTRMASAM